MANAILAYGNRVDSATLSGGSWLATLPLTNLQDRRLGLVARSESTETADTQFDLDFGSTRLFRVIALVNHNLSLTAQYRIRLSNSADFSSSVADSGWTDVWPAVYPFGTEPWGSPRLWTGKPSAEDIEGYVAPIVYILPRTMNGQYIRVEIDDQDNDADYVQLGRAFAADGWQPEFNMAYGASLGYRNRTETQEALSGAKSFNVRTSPRITKIDLQIMGEDEAMARTFEIQRGVGISGEILFIWDPDDTVHALRRQYLATLTELSMIEVPYLDRWRCPFAFEEIL